MPERDLPIQPARRERADAARNRERVLDAARRLFAERGVDDVSMDEIAAAAQVGKGTLYRRFGDRASLALALLEAEHADLQDRFLHGPAPLGPGAPARERLNAFFAALSDHLAAHGALVAAGEGGRFASGAYRTWYLHVRILLAELDPSLDADVLAHVLLAPFRAEMHSHLVGDPGSPGPERMLATVATLVEALDERARR